MIVFTKFKHVKVAFIQPIFELGVVFNFRQYSISIDLVNLIDRPMITDLVMNYHRLRGTTRTLKSDLIKIDMFGFDALAAPMPPFLAGLSPGCQPQETSSSSFCTRVVRVLIVVAKA